MLKKLSGRNKRYKNALSFPSGAPAHHSLTFNLQVLYQLKHKARLSKTVCAKFHF